MPIKTMLYALLYASAGIHSTYIALSQTIEERTCHSERSEESLAATLQILPLHFVQG